MKFRGPVARILSASILTQALGLVATVLSAGILELSEFGRLTAILVWTAFLPQVLNLSVPDTMIAHSRNMERVQGTYTNGLYLTCMLGAASMAVFGVVDSFAALTKSTSELIASFALMLLTMLSATVASLEQRLQNFGAYNRVLVVVNIVIVAGLVLAVMVPEFRVVEFVLCLRVAAFIFPVANRLIVRRALFFARPDRTVLALLRTSALFHVTAVLNALSSRADQIIATAFLSNAQLGVLGLILPFGRATKTLAYAMSTVSLVEVVEETSMAERLRKIRTSRVQSAWGGLVAGSVCGLASLAVLVTQSHLGAESSLSLLVLFGAVALYMVASGVGGSVDLVIRLQRGLGVVGPGIASRAAGAVLSIPLAWLLIVQWELIGAGVAAVAIATLSLVVLGLMTRRMVQRKVEE